MTGGGFWPALGMGAAVLAVAWCLLWLAALLG